MEIRTYQDGDSGQIIALWNLCLLSDAICPELFQRKIISDENFNSALALIAKERGRIVGFLLATKRRVPYLSRGLEEDKGWINLIFVHPEYRKMGIASTLLADAEQKLVQVGVTQIELASYSPNYIFPGIDRAHYPSAHLFFECHGYLPGEPCYAMRRYLFGYQIPTDIIKKKEKAEENGFYFSAYNNENAEQLHYFLKKNFSVGWQYNAQKITAGGKGPEQIQLCFKKDGELVGYCQRGMDDNPCRFGPFGVADEYRDHSLGSILFCEMLYDMSKRGIYMMYFLSTNEDGARFYQRHGLEKYRTFQHYHKILNSSTKK